MERGIVCRDCPAEKAEREAEQNRIKAIQQKFSTQMELLEKLRKLIGEPRQGATAYNTGNDKA